MNPTEKPIMINLLTIIRNDQSPDYPIQFLTRGMLSLESEGKAVIRYRESIPDEDSGESIQADIRLDLLKDQVTMTRSGDFSNIMVFMPDQRFEGKYRTPWGEMNMGIFSREVHCDIGQNRGAVHLKYQVDFQGNYASTNELHLEYAAEEDEGEECV